MGRQEETPRVRKYFELRQRFEALTDKYNAGAEDLRCLMDLALYSMTPEERAVVGRDPHGGGSGDDV